MGHRSLLPVAFALGALAANAQSMGEVRGKVIDERGAPVAAAYVAAITPGGSVGVYADERGRYVIKPLPTGSYSMTAYAQGFEAWNGWDITVQPDQFTAVEIVLPAKAKELGTHTVRRRADYIHRTPLIDPEQTTRQTLLAEQFKNDPNIKRPVQFLSNNFIGVTASRDNKGLHFKGSRTENMASFIDGVRIAGSLPRVPSSAISSITVYTGGLPAKYGDVTGGVVVIETKTYQELWAQARAAQLRQEFEERQTLEQQEQGQGQER